MPSKVFTVLLLVGLCLVIALFLGISAACLFWLGRWGEAFGQFAIAAIAAWVGAMLFDWVESW